MRVCPKCGAVYTNLFARCSNDDAPLEDTDRDPLEGRQLDRYHIETRLGVGSMGCVYRARHAVIDRVYALKVLFGDYANNAKFQARFRREATSISKIRHPNIVMVEDFGRTPSGHTFLAMELVEGETLQDLLARDGPLPPARAADIARQIADGLGAAHRLGFVHRDVKPANVMLASAPQPDRVKLLDFGAVSLRTAPLEERLTAVGHIIGTPSYMAPEQTQDPNVAPTADIYALGVILFEMLAGHPPFRGHNRATLIVQHLTEPAPPAPPSGGLETLVARMLRKKPSERPQSTDDVIRSLDDIAVGSGGHDDAEPPPASLPGVLDPTKDPPTAPYSSSDTGFYLAPTNRPGVGDEQEVLRKIYEEFAQDAKRADTRPEPLPRDDTQPTPPDERMVALAVASTPKDGEIETWTDDAVRAPNGDADPKPPPEASADCETPPGLDTMIVRQRNRALAQRPYDAAAPTPDPDLQRLLEEPPSPEEVAPTRLVFGFDEGPAHAGEPAPTLSDDNLGLISERVSRSLDPSNPGGPARTPRPEVVVADDTEDTDQSIETAPPRPESETLPPAPTMGRDGPIIGITGHAGPTTMLNMADLPMPPPPSMAVPTRRGAGPASAVVYRRPSAPPSHQQPWLYVGILLVVGLVAAVIMGIAFTPPTVQLETAPAPVASPPREPANPPP